MKKIAQYQIHSTYLELYLTSNETLLIFFNENSGKVYYRKKIGSPTNIKHTGVFVGIDNNGTEWWIHNHYHFGTAHLVSGAEFKKGMPIYLYKESCSNTWDTIIDKAMLHVLRGEPYKPLSYNCQTLVNDVCNNKRKSEDVERIAGGALLGLGLLAILSLALSSKD